MRGGSDGEDPSLDGENSFAARAGIRGKGEGRFSSSCSTPWNEVIIAVYALFAALFNLDSGMG